MKKFINFRNVIRLLILALDVVIALGLISIYKSDRRKEVSRVNRLKKEVIREAEMAAEEAAALSVAAEDVVGETVLPTVFSIRGDSFKTEGGETGSDYPSCLEQLFIENGTVNTVKNYTIDQPGTLADMYYAGVPQDKVTSFLDMNKSRDVDGLFGDVEKTIGNLDQLKCVRNDYDAIPILFVGYFGGWAEDPYELIMQQKAILDTYSQQQYFLIVGTHPEHYADTDKFDEIMTGYWGDHYLNISSKVPIYQLTTKEGHDRIALQIFNRLKKLELLTMAEIHINELSEGNV